MATITPSHVEEHNVYREVRYETLTENNADGTPIQMPYCREFVMQVTGTFGGGAVELQGSLDGTNFFVLDDPAGDPASLSAAGIVLVRGCYLAVRPYVASGTSVDVDVTIFAHTPHDRSKR